MNGILAYYYKYINTRFYEGVGRGGYGGDSVEEKFTSCGLSVFLVVVVGFVVVSAVLLCCLLLVC